jgi:hypothetical protein
MRATTRILILLATIVPLSARPSSAVTVDDLIALKGNGLGDEVLVALIETDGSSFNLTAADLPKLRLAGLSERVIVAMLRARPSSVASTAAHEVRTLEEVAKFGGPTIVNVAPSPVVVKESVVVQVAVPVVTVVAPTVRKDPPAPVYWGFGGTLRPGSWNPSPQQPGRDASDKSNTEDSSSPRTRDE